MKIASISAHHSTPHHIALRVDPPLTDDVFRELGGLRDAGLTLKILEGMLLVNPPAITSDILATINEHLAAAEARIHEKYKDGEQRRKEFLDPISAATGLPIE